MLSSLETYLGCSFCSSHCSFQTGLFYSYYCVFNAFKSIHSFFSFIHNVFSSNIKHCILFLLFNILGKEDTEGMLPALHIYKYIYIYICVCVCVCVQHTSLTYIYFITYSKKLIRFVRICLRVSAFQCCFTSCVVLHTVFIRISYFSLSFIILTFV